MPSGRTGKHLFGKVCVKQNCRACGQAMELVKMRPWSRVCHVSHPSWLMCRWDGGLCSRKGKKCRRREEPREVKKTKEEEEKGGRGRMLEWPAGPGLVQTSQCAGWAAPGGSPWICRRSSGFANQLHSTPVGLASSLTGPLGSAQQMPVER